MKDKKGIYEILKEIQQIIYNTKLIIGYNIDFDLSFLCNLGIHLKEETELFDVMHEFSEIYGEWSEYFESYKYQKLTTCAKYYDYEFKAHNSLEDCMATNYCFKKMLEKEEL